MTRRYFNILSSSLYFTFYPSKPGKRSISNIDKEVRKDKRKDKQKRGTILEYRDRLVDQWRETNVFCKRDEKVF